MSQSSSWSRPLVRDESIHKYDKKVTRHTAELGAAAGWRRAGGAFNGAGTWDEGSMEGGLRLFRGLLTVGMEWG